jgi:Domain of unknown function (DUF4387)
MKLADLATLIRSKNAGPFFLTFDIMFSDVEHYQLVTESRLLNRQSFAELYRCPPGSVRCFECNSALAIKFSIPRPVPQGELGDGDLHGGQQFAPLMAIDIPVPVGWTTQGNGVYVNLLTPAEVPNPHADRDMHTGQHHVPLASLSVPADACEQTTDRLGI